MVTIRKNNVIEKNKFPYHFTVRETNPQDRQEIIDWLKENFGKYGQNYIYWGIRPSKIYSNRINYYDPFEFYIRNKQDAFAFKMRWA